MSTLLIAVFIVGLIVSVILILVFITKRDKQRRRDQLLDRLNKAGMDNFLTFSSQEIFNDIIIGLDGQHRKLLVMELTQEGKYIHWLVDLNYVNRCSVRMDYIKGDAGSGRNRVAESHLEKIALVFSYSDRRDPVEIIFYSHFDGHMYEPVEVEKKARHWETLLSKMLKPAV